MAEPEMKDTMQVKMNPLLRSLRSSETTRRVTRKIREYLSVFSDPIITSYRTFTRRWRSAYQPPLNTWQRQDYAFWRRASRGQAKGLELSGLFIRPIANKTVAWTLGRLPQWQCEDEPSATALSDWWQNAHAQILDAYRASKIQGDSFVVINADLTVTLLAADCVDPIVAEDDYAQIIGWRVTQVLERPDWGQGGASTPFGDGSPEQGRRAQGRPWDKMTVIDEYYADRRIHRVWVNNTERSSVTYPNLLGMIPVVLIANQVEVGTTFGHAESEALLPLFHRYGEVMDAAIQGNILQGQPTPVIQFDTPQNEQRFWQTYGSSSRQELPDGTTSSVEVLNIDLSQIMTMSGGAFDYKSPGSFSVDVLNILQILYYLVLEHAELPEFVMGNAIASSKASAETQMPVFERFIESQRADAQQWMMQMSTIVLALLSLTTPGVVAQQATLVWQKLTQDGRLTLDAVMWAYTAGLMDARTALSLLPLDIQNIDDVLELAAAEKEQRREQALAIAGAQRPQQEADQTPPQDEDEDSGMNEMSSNEVAAIVEAAAHIIAENGYA